MEPRDKTSDWGAFPPQGAARHLAPSGPVEGVTGVASLPSSEVGSDTCSHPTPAEGQETNPGGGGGGNGENTSEEAETEGSVVGGHLEGKTEEGVNDDLTSNERGSDVRLANETSGKDTPGEVPPEQCTGKFIPLDEKNENNIAFDAQADIACETPPCEVVERPELSDHGDLVSLRRCESAEEGSINLKETAVAFRQVGHSMDIPDVQKSNTITPLFLENSRDRNHPTPATEAATLANDSYSGLENPPSKSASSRTPLIRNDPIYRLSMRLSPALLNRNVPNAEEHRQVEKSSFLQKLCGRSFPYRYQWKQRFCVLSEGKLFYYEREDGRGNDRASGVINLEYYDKIEATPTKESKKATHVFVITAHDRGHFDPGCHYFSASSAEEMKDWVEQLKTSLDLIRNNNRLKMMLTYPEEGTDEADGPLGKKSSVKRSSSEEKKKEEGESVPSGVPAEANPASGRKSSCKSKRSLEDNFTNGEVVATLLHKCEVPAPDGSVLTEDGEEMPLESITKHRVKGPKGRRAPQGKRAKIMKEKAQSLSALQKPSSGDEDTRDSPDTPGDVPSIGRFLGTNASQPALAYCYSSSSDEGTEYSKSTRTVDSGRALSVSTPPPPPPTPPQLVTYLADQFHSFPRRSRRSKIDPYNEGLTNNVHSLTSLPEEGHWMENVWKSGNYPSQRVSSGKASPVMDDLDNMLMNQSIQGMEAMIETCSNPDGSEVSTCRPIDHEHEIDTLRIEVTKMLKHIQDFSAAVHCLQHRVVDLDQNLHELESSYSVSKNEISTLHETLSGLRSDTEKVAQTVAKLSHEATKASRQIVTSSQKTEELLWKAQMALDKAEEAREGHIRAKREYDTMSKEVTATMREMVLMKGMMKEVLEKEQKPKDKPSDKGHIRKSEHDKKELPKAKSVDSSALAKSSFQKDAASTTKTGYQSFFQRPTSLIYGLTNRSSFIKTNSGNEAAKRDGTDKGHDKQKEKGTTLLEKKRKEKANSQELLESCNSSTPPSKAAVIAHTATKGSQTEERRKSLAVCSAENIPMMDDLVDHPTAENKIFVSNLSYDVSTSSLVKSPSTPTVSYQMVSQPNTVHPASHISKVLSVNQRKPALSPEFSTNYANSSASGTALAPVSHIHRTSGSQAVAESSSSAHYRPVSGSLIRQTSMTTVPEDHVVPQVSRPGSFAISRQSSSPNLPLQRQSSITVFPIQRQGSLGTVPEEGQLPRQASILSLPEDRPIVDQTLPISPSPSMVSFPLSPSASASVVPSHMNGVHSSMEAVTGPVLSGSQLQQISGQRLFPPISALDEDPPFATSTMKKENEKKRNSVHLGIVV